MRNLCMTSGRTARDLIYAGGSPESRAEVDSWLGFAATFTAEHIPSMDAHLLGRGFLAGKALSLADICAYFACAGTVAKMDTSSFKATLNFSRWFDQIQHCVRAMTPTCGAIPALVHMDLFSPVAFPLPSALTTHPLEPKGATTGGKEGGKVTAGKGENKGNGKGGDMGKGFSESVEAGKASEVEGGGEGEGKGASSGKGKKKDKSKKDKVGEAPAAENGGDEADPTKLDVRVGLIVKAWEHPDSDKLFCEEIDLGEAKTRMIASGLRSFYKLEEMQSRRVVVLANLKPRSLGGFKSEGMVLCASNADHTEVKLVEPPPDVPVGSRVSVSGTEGEPATASQLGKKKILEKCAPKLRTDGAGVPGYDGKAFVVGDAPCSSPVPNAIVS
ncbi:unnamed protein product [Discosporangium mesarthrocarpum]